MCKACQFTFPYISLIPSLFLFQNSSHLLRDYNQPITDLTALVTATSPQSCFIHVPLFARLWTVACQTPLSMEFSRQEYSSGLPFPSPGDLPDPGIKPGSPALQTHSLPSEPLGSPSFHVSLAKLFSILKLYCSSIMLSYKSF